MREGGEGEQEAECRVGSWRMDGRGTDERDEWEAGDEGDGEGASRERRHHSSSGSSSSMMPLLRMPVVGSCRRAGADDTDDDDGSLNAAEAADDDVSAAAADDEDGPSSASDEPSRGDDDGRAAEAYEAGRPAWNDDGGADPPRPRALAIANDDEPGKDDAEPCDAAPLPVGFCPRVLAWPRPPS